MTDGVCFVAYGGNALRELQLAAAQLRQVAPKLRYTAITQQNFDSEQTGRWAKLNLDTLSPYDHTLYLDVDTRVKDRAIMTVFDILHDGYDLVIAPSTNQHREVFSHIRETERETTFAFLENPMPLQLQAGVFGFRKSAQVARLFQIWRDEWQQGDGQDQAALLRALDCQPLRIWLLSWDWNSLHGSIVEHLFGRAR